MKIAILYYNFLNATGAERKIGGVETYLWNLAKLIVERGDEPILFQPATTSFEKQIEHLKIIGVQSNPKRLRKNIRKDLYNYTFEFIDKTNDIIIFGADHVSVNTHYPRSLSIQHGISWDLPGRFLRENLLGKMPLIPDYLCKKYVTYRSHLYFNNCPNRVCVDYNFLNWHRTQMTDISQKKIWVIPNFVDIPDNFEADIARHHKKPVRVLFARRFFEYRGSRLMIQAIKQLLIMFREVEFCFAGEGPDQSLIAEEFEKETRVSITKYMPHESLHIHKSFQIAVVPSLASEGTSLSLAEAMAAGCAVVATNVGGMTNMVIDGYNGRLINPSVDNLVKVLAELINDRNLSLKLGKRAAETAQEAFPLTRWKSLWSEVFDEIQNAPL